MLTLRKSDVGMLNKTMFSVKSDGDHNLILLKYVGLLT